MPSICQQAPRDIGTKQKNPSALSLLPAISLAGWPYAPLSLSLLEGEFVFAEELETGLHHFRVIEAASLVPDFLQRFVET